MSVLFVPINRAGWPFIAIFAAVTVLLYWIQPWLGVPALVLTLWCVYFFRDPDRVTPDRQGLVISPADGLVQSVQTAVPPVELELGDGDWMRISIFMNVFDVHVNRAPVTGAVERLAYRPGKFLNASLDKASEDNERQGMVLRMTDGRRVGVVQIAGLIARRIKCHVAEGRELQTGERYGLIRFGSRVDVYLPAGAGILAVQGQRAVAGETVLADLDSSESARTGTIRS